MRTLLALLGSLVQPAAHLALAGNRRQQTASNAAAISVAAAAMTALMRVATAHLSGRWWSVVMLPTATGFKEKSLPFGFVASADAARNAGVANAAASSVLNINKISLCLLCAKNSVGHGDCECPGDLEAKVLVALELLVQDLVFPCNHCGCLGCT